MTTPEDLPDAQALVRRANRLVQTWGELVLPADTLAQLREVCGRVANRERVLGDWGFGRRLIRAGGLAVLFNGPVGTGKTLAAEVIASELRLDLYKINLSAVVGKYIGETEKNLDRIFATAERANSILFFDGADAIFGKRAEVRDSHDRFANIEVAYLLQRMEEFGGLAILASNLRDRIDEAFVRRLSFIVIFPFPDEANRRRIWETVWPRETPVAEDVMPAELAREFEFSGASIRNTAVAAAFLAAAQGERVGRKHVLHAARRERERLGKRHGNCDPADPASAV